MIVFSPAVFNGSLAGLIGLEFLKTFKNLFMKKIILVFLLLVNIVNFIILVIALTNKSSSFYHNRLVIGISFIMFGGFLRQHLLSYNKKTVEK